MMTRTTSKILLPFLAVFLLTLTGPAPGRAKHELPAGLTADDWRDIRSQIGTQQPTYVKASNTDAYDDFGLSVAISGDTVVVGARNEDSGATSVNGDESDNSASYAGAAYVFVRDAAGWSQQAYLKASNAEFGDQFGRSVAISGDTIVVGAWFESGSGLSQLGEPDPSDNSVYKAGAAYVFTRSGTTWSQQAYLKAEVTDPYDWFGSSVAISGDTIVVGAYGEDGLPGLPSSNSAGKSGAAYVFERSGTVWSQTAYLKASDGEVGEGFGTSVAISADTIVVGTPYEKNEVNTGLGAAYVFSRAGGGWVEDAVLKASNRGAGDYFGKSVAISGDTIVVGAAGEDSNATGVNGDETNNQTLDSGAAYVFQLSFGLWEQQAYLKASNTAYGDSFGSSVAVSGDTIVVGAGQEDSIATGINGDQGDSTAGSSSGAAYVFTRGGESWSQTFYLKASNTGVYDGLGTSVPYFFDGSSVAISGDTVVAGAYGEDSAATGVNGDPGDDFVAGRDSGAVYVFDLVPPGGTP